MKIIRYFLFCLLTIILSGCFFKPAYYNYKGEYKLNYPTGWLALNSQKDRSKQTQFLSRIKLEDTFIKPDNVDVVLCNPQGKSPTYDYIAIDTIGRFINFNKVSKESLETLILVNLVSIYDNVQITGSQFLNITRFRALQMDLSMEYLGQSYMVTVVILPGNIAATHIFTSIYLPRAKTKALKNLNNVLQSFRKI
ncbi:MAG: hypothetical protein MJB14_10290 [Spirochaetes bacterium]|nr:hypothetical protein [Spirochaetota bacterium]